MSKVELGKFYCDRVTGFKGMAVSKTEYLEGCERFAIQPKVDKDGKLPQSEYFDEPRLAEIDGKSYYDDSLSSDQPDPGGPQPAPRGPEDPPRD